MLKRGISPKMTLKLESRGGGVGGGGGYRESGCGFFFKL